MFFGLFSAKSDSKRARQYKARTTKSRRKMLVEALETRRVMDAFGVGNLLVLRVGDGTTAIGTTAASVSLLEYTPTGTLVQTINVSSSGASALTLRGSSTTEGILSLSSNGQLVTFGGYRADNGAANPTAAAASGDVDRVIGVVDALGTVTTSQAISDSYKRDSFRSVATDDGSRFWLSGAANVATTGGVRYVANTTDTTSTAMTATGGNSRQVAVQGGNLYVSGGSATPGRSVFQVGTGLPTTGSQTLTPSFPVAASAQYNSFYFADLSPTIGWNGSAVDTLYATDTNTAGSPVAKFSFDGTNWNAKGSVGLTGLANISGSTNGSSVTLYGTTTATASGQVVVLTDASGYDQTMVGTWTNINTTTAVTAGANYAFRGIARVPAGTATQVGVTALSASKNEGNTGLTDYTFTVTRTGPITGASSVNYAVTGSGANPATADDFENATFPSGTVNFAANESSKTITIKVNGDATNESDEAFTVTLSNPTGATISTAAANGLIVNDDAATSLSIAATDAVKSEGSIGTTTFTFTVTRTGPAGATTVDYAVTGNGASPANAADFVGSVLPTGTVTFSGSETTQVISISVATDTIVEPDEGFLVTLSNNSSGSSIITASATGTILNDDSQVALSAPTSISQSEGNSGTTNYTFNLTRTGNTTNATDVSWNVIGSGTVAADATDFVGNALPSGTTSFAAGETTKTIVIPVQGDTSLESTEGFTLTLTSATNNTTVGTGLGTGTIVNDDFQTLNAGDIVITAINGDTPDQFSFVPLVGLVEGSTIAFTDNAWTGTALSTNEGVITYTAPVGGLAAGTKVVIEFTATPSIIVGTGSVAASGSFGLSTSGDSLIAYTGVSTSPNFLFSVTTWGEYITTGTTNTNTTYLPTGLVIGTSAVDALGPTSPIADVDNGEYIHASGTSGTASAIRALVANRANWQTSDTGISPLNTSNFTVLPDNVAPVITATSGTVTAPEGTSATNTGTWSDANPGDTVTLTASLGSVVKNANGTWSWSITSTDDVASTPVTITADDGAGGTATVTFNYTITNAAPTVAATNGAVTGNEAALITNAGTWGDVAADTVTLTASVGAIVKNNDGTWSWSITSPDDVSATTVTVTATDEDGGSSTTTFTYTATNVAPTLTRSLAAVSGNVLTLITNTGTYSDVAADTVTLTASTGAIVKNADGTWNWSITPSAGIAGQTVTITAADEDGGSTQVTFTLDALVAVAGRQVFYNNSGYETNGGVNSALDSSKVLLKSTAATQTTTFANVSNYFRGINGVILDIAGLASTSLTASDFTFRVAPANASGVVNPSAWAAPSQAPTSITVIAGNATTPARVRLEWNDNVIQNTWLQIIVKANVNTGLINREVFYLGHALAEVDGAAPYRITTTDVGTVRAGVGNAIVSVNDVRDIDKDRRITTTDVGLLRARVSNTVLLNNITIPAAGSGSEGEDDVVGGLIASTPAPLATPQTGITAVDSPVATRITARNTGADYSVQLPVSSISSVAPTNAVDYGPVSKTDATATETQWSLLDDYFAELGKRKSKLR